MRLTPETAPLWSAAVADTLFAGGRGFPRRAGRLFRQHRRHRVKSLSIGNRAASPSTGHDAADAVSPIRNTPLYSVALGRQGAARPADGAARPVPGDAERGAALIAGC